MSRYITRATRTRAFWVEDDLYDEPISHGTPEVCEHVATDTGLLDAHGNAIWRTPDPIGFDFERLK